MDVFSTELGIRLSFVKTSEFRGGGGGLSTPPPWYATDARSLISCYEQEYFFSHLERV
jgi:hypothetical protein